MLAAAGGHVWMGLQRVDPAGVPAARSSRSNTAAGIHSGCACSMRSRRWAERELGIALVADPHEQVVLEPCELYRVRIVAVCLLCWPLGSLVVLSVLKFVERKSSSELRFVLGGDDLVGTVDDRSHATRQNMESRVTRAVNHRAVEQIWHRRDKTCSLPSRSSARGGAKCLSGKGLNWSG